MTVGAFFSEGARREYAVRHLTPGRVLYLTCDFTKPPKEKFIVVATPDEPPLLLVVNSSVRPFVSSRPYLAVCQVTLEASDHAFLARDSFLDCSEVIDSMSNEDLLGQLSSDPARVKGEVSASARTRIVEAVRQARTISPLHKGRILAVLL